MNRHFTKTQLVTIFIVLLMIGGSAVQIFYPFMKGDDFIVVLINLLMLKELVLFHARK